MDGHNFLFTYVCVHMHRDTLLILILAISKIDEEYIACCSVQIPEKKHKNHCFLEACTNYAISGINTIYVCTLMVYTLLINRVFVLYYIVDKCVVEECYCPSIMLQSCMHKCTNEVCAVHMYYDDYCVG